MVLGDLGSSWAPLGVVLGGHGAVDGPNRAEATLVGPKNKNKKGGLLRSLMCRWNGKPNRTEINLLGPKSRNNGKPFEVTSVVIIERQGVLRQICGGEKALKRDPVLANLGWDWRREGGQVQRGGGSNCRWAT